MSENTPSEKDHCYACGEYGMEQKLVKRLFEIEGRYYILENVPALICTHCGELYFTPQAHHAMIDAIYSNKQPIRTAEVPVIDVSTLDKTA